MRLCKLILSDLILEQELTGFQPEIEALYFNLSSELPLWATKNLAIMMENTCKKIIKSAVAGRQKDALYLAYHDQEWGHAVHDDTRLFETASVRRRPSWTVLAHHT